MISSTTTNYGCLGGTIKLIRDKIVAESIVSRSKLYTFTYNYLMFNYNLLINFRLTLNRRSASEDSEDTKRTILRSSAHCAFEVV